jgi:acyl-CoA reductase-like NAD-dependent aldehyde dehydrogenase
VLAPVLVGGNTASSSSRREERPLPAITLAEVLATSDVPGGVVNILTGRRAELAPWLAERTWTSTRST